RSLRPAAKADATPRRARAVRRMTISRRSRGSAGQLAARVRPKRKPCREAARPSTAPDLDDGAREKSAPGVAKAGLERREDDARGPRSRAALEALGRAELGVEARAGIEGEGLQAPGDEEVEERAASFGDGARPLERAQ